jgi:hypothetical protein
MSLMPLLGLSEGVYEERDVFGFASNTTATLRTQSHKLHHHVDKGVVDRKLFDIRSDPAELTDIIDQEPVIAQEMIGRLERFIQDRKAQAAQTPKVEGSEHLERTLKEQGYWEMVKDPQKPPPGE